MVNNHGEYVPYRIGLVPFPSGLNNGLNVGGDPNQKTNDCGPSTPIIVSLWAHGTSNHGWLYTLYKCVLSLSLSKYPWIYTKLELKGYIIDKSSTDYIVS